MKPIDKTAPGQTDAISFELELPHAPAKVWRALIDPALLSQWLLPVVELRLGPGEQFVFTAPPQPGWDGRVRCRVLDVQEHQTLRYAWTVGDHDELNTVVTFTLTPTASGTRLSMVQSGFKPTQKHNFGGARYGWNMMGEKLFELLSRA